MKLFTMAVAAASLAALAAPARADAGYRRLQERQGYAIDLTYSYEQACKAGLDDDRALKAAKLQAAGSRSRLAKLSGSDAEAVETAFGVTHGSCAQIRGG